MWKPTVLSLKRCRLTPKAFVSTLAQIHLPAVFNPYADCCEVFDRADAPRRRRKNLEAFLEAALDHRVETIWIARDLGYRGGRRTGVPLTDEVHLALVGQLLGGVELQRATMGPAVAERTAAVIWKVLTRIGQPVVLWNVFPYHPHETDDPFSNRAHTASERETTLPLLKSLIAMFHPRRLVAIGRDAQQALDGMGVEVATVRHPSYGGQSEFMAGVYKLYGVNGEGADRQLSCPVPTRLFS
jgi:uracil-DNA glycosylase